MLTLGLDPSLTQYGWALHNSNASGRDRCPARGRFRTKSKDLQVSRYCYLREELGKLIDKYKPDRIGLESPVFHSTYSEGMYCLFMFSQEKIWKKNKDVVFFSPHQVKKFARPIADRPPKWKMGKKDMVDAAKKDVGGGKWNHNEADAYLIAVMAGRFWSLQSESIDESNLTEIEKELFTAKHTYTRGKKKGSTDYKGIIYKEDDRFYLWSSEKEK